MLEKVLKRQRRKIKIRARVIGSTSRPRLSVYKSNMFIYAQLIDDTTGKTLFGTSDLKLKKGNKVEKAQQVGEAVAKAAIEKGITSIVFDRGGFAYAGRVQALADAARSGGLVF